jgi:cytoskeletal protein CcmA (bactofilin family)
MFGKKKQPAIKSLIALGTCIEGNLKFSDGLRIDGEVRGDIRAGEGCASILVISETALVTGSIFADHVIVNGRVTGQVHAAELLELQPKARIFGDVAYQALEMYQGSIISGQLRPLGQAGEEAVPASTEKPVSHEDKPALKLAANNF